jgi:hypothetical protein
MPLRCIVALPLFARTSLTACAHAATQLLPTQKPALESKLSGGFLYRLLRTATSIYPVLLGKFLCRPIVNSNKLTIKLTTEWRCTLELQEEYCYNHSNVEQNVLLSNKIGNRENHGIFNRSEGNHRNS